MSGTLVENSLNAVAKAPFPLLDLVQRFDLSNQYEAILGAQSGVVTVSNDSFDEQIVLNRHFFLQRQVGTRFARAKKIDNARFETLAIRPNTSRRYSFPLAVRRCETGAGAWARALLAVVTSVALGCLLVAAYPPVALAALLALMFGVYVFLRTMVFWENDRFTPARVRVGLSWVLIGVDPETEEVDTGPVRIYAALLVLLLAGVVLRPLVQWLVFGVGS